MIVENEMLDTWSLRNYVQFSTQQYPKLIVEKGIKKALMIFQEQL